MIRAILFDLGDTLMYSRSPWGPFFERAARSLSDALCASGLNLDCENFDNDFLLRLDQYYSERDRSLAEPSVMSLLREQLAEQGERELPENQLRAALDKFYAITEENWALEEDALPTLQVLQKDGLRLGLISNAGDEWDVQQLVDKFGIGQYFDFIVTSAACGYRKPHPYIFEMALSQWGCLPDEVAMVGDRLDADVGGAKPLGIYTLLVRRRARKLYSDSLKPDASVDTLAEIPALVAKLRGEG